MAYDIKSDEPDYEAQLTAWQACVHALGKVERESQIRVLASVAIMLGVEHDVMSRIRRVTP